MKIEFDWKNYFHFSKKVGKYQFDPVRREKTQSGERKREETFFHKHFFHAVFFN